MGWFITCSEWTPNWRDHRSDSIPDNVGPILLAELMSPTAAFSSASNTAPCSRIISARVGQREKYCGMYAEFEVMMMLKFMIAHVHLNQGKTVRGTMIHHPCPAYMTIYVPLDSSLRMACVVFDPGRPHSHPMSPMTKLSLNYEETYRKCVRATGILGTTVQKVDDGKRVFRISLYSYIMIFSAPTTLLLLKGQSPAMYHPALHTKHLKQGIIRDEKLKASPEGLGVAGKASSHP